MLVERQLVRQLARKIDTATVRNKIATTHQGLHNMFRGKTLFECYMAGYTWNGEKLDRFLETYPHAKDFYLAWQYDAETRTIKDEFHAYNQREIGNAWIRAQFLQRMSRIGRYQGAVLDNVVNMDLLVKLSSEAASHACLTYPIKCYLLGNMFEESHLFHGIQACTTPVKNCFVNTPYQDQISQSHITSMLAYELEESPMFVNTGLWWIGN